MGAYLLPTIIKMKKSKWKESGFLIMTKYPLFPTLVGYFVVFIFFGLARPGLFLSTDNMASILNVSSELGIISLGVGLLMISGEFDLSVGSVFGFASMLFGLFSNAGLSSISSFFLVLIVSLFIGLMNGLICVRGRIPSFIATLGMMMFLRGVMLLRTAGWTVKYESSERTMLSILSAYTPWSSIRVTMFWFIGVCVLLFIILNSTKYGNNVFAVGGNKAAAKNMGVNVDRVKIVTFMACALLAGFAGATNMGRFRVADPALGTGMELEAITSAVIGGILLTGGYGNIIGALIGAILIATIRSGLIIIGVPGYFYTGVLGLVLVVTALLNSAVLRKTMRR